MTAETDGLKLNLGCGNRILRGYLNYDMSPVSAKVILWKAGSNLLDAGHDRILDGTVCEIRALQMIEHIPHSPNEVVWFRFWEECWRVMKIGASMHVTFPHGDSMWAWADPGHERAIYPETLAFLEADVYMMAENDENNPMTPYWPLCNFEIDVEMFANKIPRLDGFKDEVGTVHAELKKIALPEGYADRRSKRA